MAEERNPWEENYGTSSGQQGPMPWEQSYSADTTEKPRTWGEAAKDTGAALMQGGAGLVKSAGDLYGLASGDMNNAVSQLGQSGQEYWEEAKSGALRRKIAKRKEDIDASPSTLGKAWTAVKETVTDPALAMDTVAGNAATMLPGAAAGRLAAGAKMAAGMKAAQEFGPVALGTQSTIASQAARIGTGVAVGAGAAQQGADVSGDIYGDLMKKPDATWDANPDFAQAIARNGGDREAAKRDMATQVARASFLPAAGISAVANAFPGATMLEKSLIGGAARDTIKEGTKYAIPKAIAKGMVGEGTQEFVEEGGGRLAANIAAQKIADPSHDTWDQVGENAGMGLAGGLLMGAGGGAFHRQAHTNQPTPPEQPPQPPSDQSTGVGSGMGGTESFVPPAFTTNPQPTTLGTQTTATAGPGFDANSVLPRVDPLRDMVQQSADAGGSISAAALVGIDSGAHEIQLQAALLDEKVQAASKDMPADVADAWAQYRAESAALQNQPGESDWATQAADEERQQGPLQIPPKGMNMEQRKANLAKLKERMMAGRNNGTTNAVQSLPATGSGIDGNQQPTSMGLGNADGNGLGADSGGYSANPVVQSGEQSTAEPSVETTEKSKNLARLKEKVMAGWPQFKSNPQPTTLGTQTTAKAGPGFDASYLPQGTRNVSQAPQAVTSSPQQQEAGNQAPVGAATTTTQPGTAGGSDVQATGVTVSQPAQPAVNAGEGASQPTQTAPNQPALDRIAKGEAWFGNELKARNWVQKNGLADTHDVRMTKPGRFEVVAKNGNSEQTAPSNASTGDKNTANKQVSEQKAQTAKDYIASVEQAKQDAQQAAQDSPRETVTPAEDKPIGKNDAGEQLFERKDGSVYRMRDGKPDFGGDLAPKQPSAPATTASDATENVANKDARYKGPSDVSSRDGQMELANRAGAIATLKAMNDQLRRIAPDEAWHDRNIEDANDLDALRDQISQALVNANRKGGETENPLRKKLESLSGDELKAVFAKMNLAGKILTYSERIDMLMHEDAKDVEAAIADITPTTSNSDRVTGPKVNLLAAASELGVELSASVRAALEAQQEGKVQDAVADSKPTDKIADFGEKIGGAKKDTWTGFKDDLSAVQDGDIAAHKLSEIWPAPDYQKMIDDGMDAQSVAVIRALRDEIPSKPRNAYKLQRWAEQVKTMRDLATNILNNKDTGAGVVAQLERGTAQMRGLAGRVALYMEVGHGKSLEGIRLAHHHYSLYRGRENVSLWVVERDAAATAFSNFPQELATGDTKEDAIAAFKARYAELDALTSSKKASYDIFSKRGDKGFYIGKKIGRNVAELAGPFENLKDARDYRTNNVAELDAKLEQYKQIPKDRRDTNEPRVGEDMRNGQDVTPEMFAEAFGFRGVEFGNWVEQKRRQKDLNDAFDALMDMAAIIGIPSKAISLNGELGLAFGARGSGGTNPAAAHYEPGKIVINLTKREGAGSLGHEWWHALDNYFSRMRGSKTSPFMTTTTDVGLAARGSNYEPYPGVRKEMIDAFGEVVKAIHQTAMKARSTKIDAKRTKEYWTTGEEMAARAFESYLISKLHDQNASNDYLANVVDQKTWDAMAALGMENENSYPYPTAGEMPVIRAGFDALFKTMQARETDNGKIGLFNQRDGGDVAPAEAQRVQSGIEGKSLIDAARFIAETGEKAHTEVARKVIEKLQWLQDHGANLRLIVAHRGDSVPSGMIGSRGYTQADLDNKGYDVTVWLHGADMTGSVGVDYETVLHEMVHAATTGELLYARNNPNTDVGNAYADLNRVSSAVEDHINQRFSDAREGKVTLTEFEKDIQAGANNAFRNLDEFVSWALTSRDAQEYLDSIPYKSQSLWTRFVQAIRTALGLNANADTALSEILRVSDVFLSNNGNKDRGITAFWHKRGIKMSTTQANGSIAIKQHNSYEAGNMGHANPLQLRMALGKHAKTLAALERKGLVTLTQTQDQAVTAAAKARAAITGEDAGDVKRSMLFTPEADNSNALEKWQSSLRDAVKNPQAKDPRMATPTAIRMLGAKAANLILPRTYLSAILNKHQDVPASVFEHLPALLADPLFIISHKDGGLRVFVQAQTTKGEPIVVGLSIGSDGRIQTITPFNDDGDAGAGIRRRNYQVSQAFNRGEKMYARNNEALEQVRASATAAPGLIPLHRGSVSKATVITRSDVVKRMDAGALDIKRSTNGQIQGFYDPITGKSFLIADALTAKTVTGVLMHEVGIHMAADGSMNALFDRAGKLMESNDSFMARVRERMKLAGETGNEEAAAYIAEEFVNDEESAPKSVKDWISSVYSAIRAWMFRKGIVITADHLTPADIAAVARANVKALADGTMAPASGSDLMNSSHSPEANALRELSKIDDMFVYPKSDKTDMAGIIADNDPGLKFKESSYGNETLYKLTIPNVKGEAKIWVRKPNPYGPSVYGMDLVDGEATNLITERPGDNPDDVPPDTEDVYIDVSDLKEGDYGALIYNIAATYAHNTGRIFIGDPNGLSDIAMRRRLENMISTAIKFGTTDHIAPHPKQVDGNPAIGVPPLEWVYGDSVGNLERMIDVSLQSSKNAGNEEISYEPDAGNFTLTTPSGEVLAGEPGASAERLPSVPGSRRKGWRTAARAAIFNALLREPGQASSGQGRRNGLLERLLSLGNQRNDATRQIFYSRRSSGAVQGAGAVTKSSIGNNADIRFSRNATLQKVGDVLNESFNYPGTVSKWDTTVGSMYHLSERFPAFKPVFDAAQNFLNDVSYYATEAADMAPKILPKLESWRDLVKTPITYDDNKAISAPILQGTTIWARDVSGKPVLVKELARAAADMTTEQKAQDMLRAGKLDPSTLRMWQGMKEEQYAAAVNPRYESTMLHPGVLWKDDELKRMFNLNDTQIGLYKEFRKATDTSLDNAAKAVMLRVAGKDAKALREMVMDAPTAEIAGLILRDHFQAMAGDDESRSDQHIATANQMMDMADKVEKLKKEGYAPLSRFGKYKVTVKVDGEVQYFGMFESKRAANRMAILMSQEYGHGNVIQGTMSEREFEQYQGITPETLELFGNMLGLNSTGNEAQDKVFQDYLRLTKANRSAMKRLIHRKGTAGFSEDIGRILAAFVYSNARQTASSLNLGTLGEAVNDIPQEQGELKDVAIGLQKYVTQPVEEAQAIRGMMFAQYLGGSVASMLVNLTQPMAVSFPYLSQFGGGKSFLGGAKRAAAALTKAYADMAKGDKALESQLQQALRVAEEKGIVAPQEVHQLQAQAQGKSTLQGSDGTRMGEVLARANNNFTKLALGWGKLFGFAEQINRRATFIAAYRLAVENGNASPAEFATKAVNETQFINNRGNKMRWGRGAVGATLMTFKSYSINYLELLHRMATQNGKEGKMAAALMLGMLVLMAGAGGLPFAEDLNDAIDFLAERMGYNFSTKKAKQEFLEGLLGKPMADFVDRGITGLPGSPIDVSGRMSMANLIPGTGLLLEKRDHSRDAQELLGPVGDMAKRAFDGANAVLDGDIKRALLSVAPKAISNAYQGANMLDKGYYADAKGFKVLSTTPGDAVAKAIGFQPQSVSMVQEANAITQRMKDTYALHAERIRSEWAKGVFEHDPEQIQKARDMLADWNAKNPGQTIIVRIPDVMKKAREMAKDKDQRIADTAPKAMRAQLKQEIQQRRAMQ